MDGEFDGVDSVDHSDYWEIEASVGFCVDDTFATFGGGVLCDWIPVEWVVVGVTNNRHCDDGRGGHVFDTLGGVTGQVFRRYK